uniref:Retinol dehydrogenase 7-like n=1 Tax=Geotrypetes seraphini TaxID=260995 RepID=A0A6P8Q7H1_GEOSA|nr:retinol dehydrogenase 7-like [Geotrypetes seraphini]XP_033791371.1 retinol dehydrogenase 7-like [Geotrypetes seraphini]XP_033791372.1 retinol dehydrogenase 7-like [Geotrypetes seraphini]XP_033791373.1 retinol dehydrogenase 7-like [Geotrypetes seraphini]XP_033791374.1 retinol dehydrogenase 7-like [Geotrypetes seraphini]
MWLWLLTLVGFYILFRWYQDRQILQNLTDKYVFITGCDSGFGNLLACKLDGQGLCVLAACLTKQGAEQLKEATSQRLQTIILDVTESESVAAAVDWVRQQVGDKGLWGLVNNAGILLPLAPFEWLTKADFQKVMDVNLMGLIEVTVNLLPLLRRAKGRIVNIASIMGRVSYIGGAYNMSKYGVEAFSDGLRRDPGSFGVKVSIVEPGFFRTHITEFHPIEEYLQGLWSHLPAEIKNTYGQKFFDAYCRATQQMVSGTNPNLSLVTDCMEHALTAVYPRTRYAVGWDAKSFYIPISYLPTVLADFLLTPSLPRLNSV